MATQVHSSHDNAFPAAVIARPVARTTFRRTTRAETDALFERDPILRQMWATFFEGASDAELDALRRFECSLADAVDCMIDDLEEDEYATC